MPVKPWKDGLHCEIFPNGAGAQTFRLGKPSEEQRGTASRESREEVKNHTQAEWEAMNAPESVPDEPAPDEKIEVSIEEPVVEKPAPKAKKSKK